MPISMMTPVPMLWWLRPASSAAARRAAQGRGVEAGVLQPVVRELVHVRRRHRPAERRAHAEADVVEQDDQHVRAALRRLHRLRVAGRRVLVRLADLALERGVGLRQLRACRRAWPSCPARTHSVDRRSQPAERSDRRRPAPRRNRESHGAILRMRSSKAGRIVRPVVRRLLQVDGRPSRSCR